MQNRSENFRFKILDQRYCFYLRMYLRSLIKFNKIVLYCIVKVKNNNTAQSARP